VNYSEIDDKLRQLLDILTEQLPSGKLYVPMPTTVWLLRRLNAVCARNMIATDYQVNEQEKGVQRKGIYEFKARARKDRGRGGM
jgi:hypothetical protein